MLQKMLRHFVMHNTTEIKEDDLRLTLPHSEDTKIQNIELTAKGDTMFRFSVVVCVSLIFGITAKPHKPWYKLTDAAFQDTVMSIDDEGKMSWGVEVEVEPPEVLDDTHYEMDPSMMIWKSMAGNGKVKLPLKAEAAVDELYHPSMAELLQDQINNVGVLPAADIQAEPAQEDASMKEPEQDWDEVYHKAREELEVYLAPLTDEYQASAEVRVAQAEPEEDEDDLYHRDNQRSPVQMELLTREVRGGSEVIVHLQPEEDMDDLYHKDLLQPILYQDADEPVAPVDVSSQRRYNEPEEDLDDLYHQ
ncbi:Hypothetical protein SMAX5B_017934 [Scophthalmus maximus]|uniref:Uncharacterized protein n=1 Tax=Scophthalmus maximus TaxID=52904 RepID=A0A2U9CC51_SCOMX|nr:Hypothetical protein SMAX5B_017934 [Scophthalmus maximus]